MTNMFNGMDKLSQITVGANFSFKGSGTSVKCKLPIPTSTDEDKWYIANGTVYTTTQIASKKAAATYYAVDPSMKITAPSSITGGRISPSGTVSVEEGTNKIFTISPTSGYHIKTITVDGTNIEITNKSSMQYTFSNVTENHTISAIFEKCAGGTATCSSKATCTTCSSEYGTMLGHNYTEATCEEAKTCSVCGATEGEALGHNYTEATCSEAKTCSVCGATEGEALGHNYTEATCSEAKTCSVCGATEGEALGHNYTEATCTEAKTCSVCGATEGEALGHTYEVVQEADCEKEEIKECTRCQDRKTTKDSLGHTIVYRFDDTYHWQGCEVCAFESEEKLPHTGGIATSTTKAICETCSTPYGGFVYTVTYNANGGTGSMTSQTFAEGTAQSLTANSFSRSGYTFLGWSTTKTGSVEFSNGANYTATADITLYAIWQKNSSGGGGSGGGGSSSSKPSKEEVTKPEETQKPQDEEKVEEKEEILEEEILEEELPKEEKDIILIIGKANDYNEILLSLKDLLEIYGLDGEIKCTKTKATYSSKDQTIEFEDGKLNITVNNIADVLARPVKIINKKVYITLTDFLDLM